MRPIQDTLKEKAPMMLLALVLLTAVAFYLCNITPKAVGTFQDDGIYTVTAKALAEGRGYKLINMSEPLPQTKYPIFYPLLLSLVWKLSPSFPANLIPLKLISVTSALLFLILTYIFITKYNLASNHLALGVVAMSALNPYTLCFSSMIMSEMPYALIVISALFLLKIYEDKRDNFFWLGLAVSLAIGLACLTRVIGITLALSCFLYFIWKRQFKKLAIVVPMVLLTISPWITWVGMNSRLPKSQVETHQTSYTTWLSDYTGHFELNSLAHVSLNNTINALHDISTFINPLVEYVHVKPVEIPQGPLSFILLVLFAALPIGIVITMIRRGYQFTPIGTYMIFYLLAIALWPWPPWRFLVPILPFVFLYVLKFIGALAKFISAFLGKYKALNLPRTVTAVIVFANLMLNLTLDVAFTKDTRRYGWVAYPYQEHPNRTWKDMEEIFEQISSNTPPDAVLSSIYDSMIYLYTGRKTISCYTFDPLKTFYKDSPSAAKATSVNEIVDNLRIYNIDYLIYLKGSEFVTLGGHLEHLHHSRPGLLTAIYRSPDKRLFIFQVNQNLIKGKTPKLVYAQ